MLLTLVSFCFLPHELILVQPKQTQCCLNAEALAAFLIDVIYQVRPIKEFDCSPKAEHRLLFEIPLKNAIDVAPVGNL